MVRRLLVMLAGVSGSDARRCLVWAVSWAPGVWFLEEEVDGFGRLKVLLVELVAAGILARFGGSAR